MRFSSIVTLSGKTATGIEVPPDLVEALGQGKRPAVTVTIGSHSYRTTIAPMGGSHWIPVSAEHRAAAGLTAGDAVEVDVEPDTAPRTVEVPDDLATALAATAGARPAFEALSYSNQQRHVLSVTGAKTEATRTRRVAAVVEALLA